MSAVQTCSLSARLIKTKSIIADKDGFDYRFCLVYSSISGSVGCLGQDRTQVIGRLQRKPQKSLVHVYLPCINNTTDDILNGMSLTKERLLDIFLGELVRSGVRHVPSY